MVSSPSGLMMAMWFWKRTWRHKPRTPRQYTIQNENTAIIARKKMLKMPEMQKCCIGFVTYFGEEESASRHLFE
ncbi:hypothetical protein LSAT2_021252 [Lamellibrachia satsuma]|nr:hypothetical protein LSAT2_021252 [Lamellibrachia satsuma]